MEKQEQIKAYWNRINKIEERIEELARKGLSYGVETQKRKSLITNVRRLEKNCLIIEILKDPSNYLRKASADAGVI
jgi:hypothetical protein